MYQIFKINTFDAKITHMDQRHNSPMTDGTCNLNEVQTSPNSLYSDNSIPQYVGRTIMSTRFVKTMFNTSGRDKDEEYKLKA